MTFKPAVSEAEGNESVYTHECVHMCLWSVLADLEQGI